MRKGAPAAVTRYRPLALTDRGNGFVLGGVSGRSDGGGVSSAYCISWSMRRRRLGCCAHTLSGQAAEAPPSSLINWRRFIHSSQYYVCCPFPSSGRFSVLLSVLARITS